MNFFNPDVTSKMGFNNLTTFNLSSISSVACRVGMHNLTTEVDAQTGLPRSFPPRKTSSTWSTETPPSPVWNVGLACRPLIFFDDLEKVGVDVQDRVD
jgi:hypothetical protein